ncbi:TPA: hypothetical protein ACGZ96_002418 [Elizabethkingia anophelis]|uniref:hypothetical protein n=1 Tax=Elizabethkingia anophelis TaxID=1117645 RepID=UPI00248E644E|nr:hypothetical protein [Elizabethkingia anophelis]WBS71178.1 hypothetical protein PF435_18510 [Elizabethkingia anophelis]
MRKKILFAPLWGIFALSLLSSCRTEDNLVQQNKTQEAKYFSVFVPKSGEKINYANGFAFLMKRYDELHKTNLSGINNNPVLRNLSASTSKNASVFQSTGVYVEFAVRSQTITEENGDKWVVFPKVEGSKVVSLVAAVLSQKETYVSYHTISEGDELYKRNINRFQEALARYQKQRVTLALNASINPMAGSGCSNNGVEYDNCGIPEVVIDVPPRGGGGGGTGFPDGGGSGCLPYELCDPGVHQGGGSSGSAWSNDLLLYSKNPSGEKITNIKDYLKCLNLSQGATVTLYVAQPTPNTTDTWSGSVTDPNVGHTFISITQGGTTRFMGFYPSQGISPFSSPPAAKGVLINDQGHSFNVSITSNINSTQLSNLVGYINSVSTATYNLNTFNCTNFGIDAAAKVGISLPKTSGSWPGGGGSNPGNLGQDLRNLNNSSVQKNTSGGNAPKNTGSCN